MQNVLSFPPQLPSSIACTLHTGVVHLQCRYYTLVFCTLPTTCLGTHNSSFKSEARFDYAEIFLILNLRHALSCWVTQLIHPTVSIPHCTWISISIEKTDLWLDCNQNLISGHFETRFPRLGDQAEAWGIITQISNTPWCKRTHPLGISSNRSSLCWQPLLAVCDKGRQLFTFPLSFSDVGTITLDRLATAA